MNWNEHRQYFISSIVFHFFTQTFMFWLIWFDLFFKLNLCQLKSFSRFGKSPQQFLINAFEGKGTCSTNLETGCKPFLFYQIQKYCSLWTFNSLLIHFSALLETQIHWIFGLNFSPLMGYSFGRVAVTPHPPVTTFFSGSGTGSLSSGSTWAMGKVSWSTITPRLMMGSGIGSELQGWFSFCTQSWSQFSIFFNALW